MDGSIGYIDSGQSNTTGIAAQQNITYWPWPTDPHPCPTCGHCPTCGPRATPPLRRVQFSYYPYLTTF